MSDPETNAIELAAVAAPRPQLILSCGLIAAGATTRDPTHDFPTTGFPFIKEVYRRVGHPERVRNLHFSDEAHDYGPSKRKALYAFFAEYLGLKLLDEDLSKIRIEKPELMEVWNAKHPLPRHAVQGKEGVAKAFAKLHKPPASKPGK